jgi:hypothetical protein
MKCGKGNCNDDSKINNQISNSGVCNMADIAKTGN